MIHFTCECGQRMTADDEHGGMTSECPQCKQRVSIPQSDAIGADLVAAPAVDADADAEAAAATGEEAVLFAEQMGLEVEQTEPDPQSASAVAPDAADEPFDAEAAAELEFDAEAVAELELAPIDTSPQARANRAQRSQAVAQRRAQHHFKKAAIPLMLVMSLLLLIFAIWSIIDLAGTPTESIRQRATYMMFSWPVILVLLFGAWWFGRDIRRSEQG